MHAGDRARQHGSDRAVDVACHLDELHALAVLDGGARALDELAVQRVFDVVVLHIHMEARYIGGHVGLGEQAAEVQATGLPVFQALAHVEQVGAADQLVELADAQLGHDLAHFFGDEEEVVHHVFGLPENLARNSGSCVATPTGQVFRWHLRIMMQPSTTSGAVAKPNSSAPSSAPMATSRPVFIWPSACTRMRPRRRLSTRVCWVSARPISQEPPACLMDDQGEAPVPPSWPAITTW